MGGQLKGPDAGRAGPGRTALPARCRLERRSRHRLIRGAAGRRCGSRPHSDRRQPGCPFSVRQLAASGFGQSLASVQPLLVPGAAHGGTLRTAPLISIPGGHRGCLRSPPAWCRAPQQAGPYKGLFTRTMAWRTARNGARLRSNAMKCCWDIFFFPLCCYCPRWAPRPATSSRFFYGCSSALRAKTKPEVSPAPHAVPSLWQYRPANKKQSNGLPTCRPFSTIVVLITITRYILRDMTPVLWFVVAEEWSWLLQMTWRQTGARSSGTIMMT